MVAGYSRLSQIKNNDFQHVSRNSILFNDDPEMKNDRDRRTPEP